jgi:hypothetical protein
MMHQGNVVCNKNNHAISFSVQTDGDNEWYENCGPDEMTWFEATETYPDGWEIYGRPKPLLARQEVER